jgi:glutathione S-transferase
MKLYHHPVSSYSQKALMAFYEKGIEFEPALVNLMTAEGRAEYAKVNPLEKIPFLKDEARDWAVPESTIIIEYLEDTFPDQGTRLIPTDKTLARQTRFLDRMFDLYLNDQVQKILFDSLKPEEKKDPVGVATAKKRLRAFYALMDKDMSKRTWAIGDDFSMADCAAASPLFYAKNVFPYDDHPNIRAYAKRLHERPSYKRILDQALPILEKMRAQTSSK